MHKMKSTGFLVNVETQLENGESVIRFEDKELDKIFGSRPILVSTDDLVEIKSEYKGSAVALTAMEVAKEEFPIGALIESTFDLTQIKGRKFTNANLQGEILGHIMHRGYVKLIVRSFKCDNRSRKVYMYGPNEVRVTAYPDSVYCEQCDTDCGRKAPFYVDQKPFCSHECCDEYITENYRAFNGGKK